VPDGTGLPDSPQSDIPPRGNHASRTVDFLILYIQSLHPNKSSVILTALRASLNITMMMSASIQMCMCTCCCMRASSGTGKLMI
jgi:hypothetical protein